MTKCLDRTCGNYRAGLPFVAGRDCPACWNGVNRLGLTIPSRHPAPSKAAAKPTKAKPAAVPDCIHRGEATGERVLCGSCGGGVQLPVLACAVHGKCVAAKEPKDGGIQCCRSCTSRETKAPPAVAKESLTTRIDASPPAKRTRIALPAGYFNAGLIDYRGLIMASRFRERIYLTRLSDTFEPLSDPRPLNLPHPLCAAGAEDPRLFLHRGRLHVGFAGISHVGRGKKLSDLRITQLYAEFDDLLNVVAIHAPTFPGIGPIEKNWGWFEHDSDLYAVYSISPHVAVRILDGQRFETPNSFPWSGGYLRGGAPPVRVGDEYVCWFHGSEESPAFREYNMGRYTFEASPPFRITSVSPDPLMWADATTRPKGITPSVVFPCGAVLRDRRWLVSAGVHDSWVDILEWPA